MNNKIVNTINEIEENFMKLKSAVEHINSAEKTSRDIIKSNIEISAGFKNTVISLEKLLIEDFKKSHSSIVEKSELVLKELEKINFEHNHKEILDFVSANNEILDSVQNKNFDKDFLKIQTELHEVKNVISTNIQNKNFNSDFKKIFEFVSSNNEILDSIQNKNFDHDFLRIQNELHDVKSVIITKINTKNFNNDFAKICTDLISTKTEISNKIQISNKKLDTISNDLIIANENTNSIIKGINYLKKIIFILIVCLAIIILKIFQII